MISTAVDFCSSTSTNIRACTNINIGIIVGRTYSFSSLIVSLLPIGKCCYYYYANNDQQNTTHHTTNDVVENTIWKVMKNGD